MQDLDVLHLPLHGIRLIEASAGTGKTYNLIIIYLRLLLNLRGEKTFKGSCPLTTKEILVVTFTNAAAQELRKRIKDSIKQFQLDCIYGYSHNYLFSKLLSQINNINLAMTLLSVAAKEINQASIFTIHGFCQKILTEYTIDLQILFHLTITKDELVIYQQACSDVWRRQFYPLPLNITRFIQKHWKNPYALLQDVFPYIHKEYLQFQDLKYFNDSNNNINEHYLKIINCIKNIKQQWTCNQNLITDSIILHNINHKIYNKYNLDRWTKTINQWANQPTYDHIVPDNLKRFKLSKLNITNNFKKSNMFVLFNLIEDVYHKLFSLKVLILNITIKEIRKKLDISKSLRSNITFNDLVDLLFQNIVQNKNNTLIQKILLHYPIAIIDEFQDTDYNQYKIFYSLYSNHVKNGLILIGDPKQAIYGFRGADIYTYIKIRKSLPYKYNLNINWRSSPSMVNAVNQLFKLPYPFIFKDIPFIPVQSAYKNRTYNFFIHNTTQPAISFWLHNYITTMHDYKITMAKECAAVIQNLLSHIYNKTAWIKISKHKKKLYKYQI